MSHIVIVTSLIGKDLSDFFVRESQVDNSKGKRSSLQNDRSRLNDSGLRRSKRRKTEAKGIDTNILSDVKIRSSGDTSFAAAPLLNVAGGVSLSTVPSITSITSATSAKPVGGLSRISRKTTKSRPALCISKSFCGDSPRIPSRSRIENSNVLETEGDAVMMNPCRSFKSELKMWTDEYSPTSVSEMVLHSSNVAPLLEWMRLWDVDLQTTCAKTYLVFGPTGCGKTALVYALATQHGYKVFELNPSSCRSGKAVMSQCSPVMISQHVSTEFLSVSSSISDLSKGLKLINKSLILFDDVDVLFDTDRGFWHAVGKLLQVGRRPIFFTASDPSVLREIPVPYQTCELLPLTSSILVKPILQRICDSRGLILTDSLMLALTRRENEDCTFGIFGRISGTARELVSSREFSNIRQSIVRLQWIMGSGEQYLDRESNRMSSHDLISTYSNMLHRLFSLSFVIPQAPSQDLAKSVGDEFVDVFASDTEEKSSVSEERRNRLEPPTVVKLPLAQCKKLSVDMLSELARATELQALLDMCSTASSRSEISRGIESLPLNITSSPNLMTVFGDVYSAPLSGIDPVGICGTFACEEEWRRLLHLTTLHNLTRLERQLLALPIDSESLAFGSYVNERSAEDSFSSMAFDKAVATLASLRAFNAERKSGESLFQREFALDFLPSLRSIGRAELHRKGLATRRRFFHYFDRIGLRLPQDVFKFLSQ
ncbi:Replication factor C large subunit [Taenia crassiceps]|uniref:Replication factor C large subunit n=1 Tax=Taenia crassiceps TaxID=6207 RepID=A0ABR4QJJ1_9CEST